jgi:hypothetical protein
MVILVPTDISLGRLEEFVGKMTKEYFNRAYM